MKVKAPDGVDAGKQALPNVDFSAYLETGGLPWQRRQRVFEAMARLQVERYRVASALEHNRRVSGRIIGRGPVGINRALADAAKSWRSVESVRHTGTVGQLMTSLPNNAFLIERGLRMVSLWSYSGLEPEARLVLSGEDPSVYFFVFAPMQMKIIDGTSVLLDGPSLRGDLTVMEVTDAACLAAARGYWDAVSATRYPCDAETAALVELSPRQRRIVTLMLTSSSDEEIARKLGVSVRTVRADIAAVLSLLDAPTRFVAGLRLRERLGVPAPQPTDPVR
ncbi:sigma factor-like helix-turn-helix DNA-binding protein [Promicromonospora sp. NPDC052451]|uniref:helix-turn-helix transcriptional regulator n=1 Tax=unclassified Promicromonospora TaxID=2647929 RepID=UPI0037C642CC